MSFELFIAMRYLRAKRKQTFISVISFFSVVGIALGVASLIVAMGIMNGFTNDFREKILEANPHIIVYNLFGPMTEYEEIGRRIESVPGVKLVTPFLYTDLVISSAGGAKGVMLRGIDPKTAAGVISVLNKLEKGDLQRLEALEEGEVSATPGIIIGRKLARDILKVDVGQRVNLLSPSGRRSTAGFTPKISAFSVAGIFSTGMFAFDSSLAFVSIESARDLLGLSDQRIHGLEVAVNEVFNADKIAGDIHKALGDNYTAESWMTSNSNVFAALQLEKLAMGIVLTIIILVASFSVFTTLIMMVMEKTRDIAILMSIGATRKSVARIFWYQGMIICSIGTIIGFGLGTVLSVLLKKYEFIKLPEGVYPVNHVPMLLQTQDLMLIALSSVVICALATLYPARRASRLTPVEALQYE